MSPNSDVWAAAYQVDQMNSGSFFDDEAAHLSYFPWLGVELKLECIISSLRGIFSIWQQNLKQAHFTTEEVDLMIPQTSFNIAWVCNV